MTAHSNKIANLSFVCACLVVLIHTPAIATGGWLGEFFIKWIKSGLTIVSVPLFFIISGYFIGRHILEVGWYNAAISRRIKSLVIPFFVLNTIWFLVKYLLHYIGVRCFGADGSNQEMNLTVYNAFRQVGLLPWGGECGNWFLVYSFIILSCSFITYFCLVCPKGQIDIVHIIDNVARAVVPTVST